MPIPIATYRLQLTPAFGFDAAVAVIPHIVRLGASHLYLSPIFEATPGSTHGYDQTNPNELRSEFGGAAAFDRLAIAASDVGLDILIDIVPNHVASHHANPWWWGLLAEGRGSRFDKFFDVDWDAGNGRVVLPVLGKALEQVVADGEIAVDPSGAPVAIYYERRLPLRNGSWKGDLATLKGDALLATLRNQHYELAEWRSGLQRINYRRFFDIADLAGVRVDEPEVFDELHAGVFKLIADGQVQGLRLDHVDGLADPRGYCRLLRERVDAIAPAGTRPWIVIEKILAPDESVPDDWGVDGTTGYDFLAASAGILVDPGTLTLTRAEAHKAGAALASFTPLRIACKAAAAKLLGPELARVSGLAGVAFTTAGLAAPTDSIAACLVAICSHLTVYRTYVDERGISDADSARIETAASAAEADLDNPSQTVLPNVVALLTLAGPFADGPANTAAHSMIRLWQQFTGPAAAKGVEDTALYRDTASPALNDVGSEPELHDPLARLLSLLHDRAANSPLTMNATATHDTKRGEDTRTRIAAAVRTPETIAILTAARAACQPLLVATDNGPAPAPTDLGLILHSLSALMPLIGPIDAELGTRLKAYIRKAARESKVRTSWINSNHEYESACDAFIDQLIGQPSGDSVLRLLRQLAAASRGRALQESIAAVLLKVIGPGVPDIYQGCECLDLSLVDPDNRRPVAWHLHRQMLADLAADWSNDPASAIASAMTHGCDDRKKMAVTWRALQVRRWLVQKGGPIHIDSWTDNGRERHWTFTAGERSGRVWIALDGLAAVNSSTELNQLIGASGSGRSSPIGLVVDGFDSLI